MCLFLASKYDELDDNIPLLKDFLKLTNNKFTYEEAIKCESYLLGVLNWDLMVVTPLHYLYNYLYQGVIFAEDKQVKKKDELGTQQFNSLPANGLRMSETVKLTERVIKNVRKYSEFFVDLSTQIYDVLKYPPSVIAACCVLCAKKVNGIEPLWNSSLRELLRFEYTDLEECYRRIYQFYLSCFGP